jgi:hypothetical protein
MRKSALVHVALTATVLTISLLGCRVKTRGDDAPAIDAGTISVSGTGAKNEAQITRYPNETNLSSAPALIAKDGTIVRASPGAGAQVAVLNKSTPCGKVAQFGNAATLIVWNEPDGTAMMGWVPSTSFQGSVNPSTIKPVVVIKDAGAPAVQDAGGSTPPNPPAAVDAGGGGAPSFGPCPVSCPAQKDQCPAGKKNDNGMCRIPCKKTEDCPRGVSCNARQVCSSG